MCKIAHSLLGFPWDAVVLSPHSLGFAGMLSSFTNGGVTPDVANMSSVFTYSQMRWSNQAHFIIRKTKFILTHFGKVKHISSLLSDGKLLAVLGRASMFALNSFNAQTLNMPTVSGVRITT